MREIYSKSVGLLVAGSMVLAACAPVADAPSGVQVVTPPQGITAPPPTDMIPYPTLPPQPEVVLSERPGVRLIRNERECTETMRSIQDKLIQVGVVTPDVAPVTCKQANFSSIGCQMIDQSTVACNFNREEIFNMPTEVVLAHEYCHAKQIPFSNIVAELQCATFEVVYSGYDVTARGSRYKFDTAFQDKNGKYFSYYPYQFAYDLRNLGVTDEDLIRFAFDPRAYDKFKALVAVWLADNMVDTDSAAFVEWMRTRDSNPNNDFNNPGVLATRAFNYSPVSWYFVDIHNSPDDPCNPFKEGFARLVSEGWCQFEQTK